MNENEKMELSMDIMKGKILRRRIVNGLGFYLIQSKESYVIVIEYMKIRNTY